jgi:hypothetical protein
VLCPENFEKKIDEMREEFVCVAKQCEERKPWKNGSCSVEEDFLLSENENSVSTRVKCYYIKESNFNYTDYDDDNNDKLKRCVREDQCPSDYPGV